jgi:hypothetical protein
VLEGLTSRNCQENSLVMRYEELALKNESVQKKVSKKFFSAQQVR